MAVGLLVTYCYDKTGRLKEIIDVGDVCPPEYYRVANKSVNADGPVDVATITGSTSSKPTHQVQELSAPGGEPNTAAEPPTSHVAGLLTTYEYDQKTG